MLKFPAPIGVVVMHTQQQKSLCADLARRPIDRLPRDRHFLDFQSPIDFEPADAKAD